MNRIRTRHPAALALLVGGAMAALVPVGTAVAQDSPPTSTATVEIESAQLVAKGAATDVTLSYSCPAGAYAYVGVQVTQRSGPEITSGSSYFNTLSCTGDTQQVVLRVTATNGMRAFKAGTALVQANLNTCSFTCVTVSDSEEVSIRR